MNSALDATGRGADRMVEASRQRGQRFRFDPTDDPLDRTPSPISPLRTKTPTFRPPRLDPADHNTSTSFNKPPPRSVTFMPSQIGSPDQVSISYTATPFRLLWYDVQLILGKLPSTMGVMLPWRVGEKADPWDEMYPSGRNLLSIGLHAVLIVAQAIFVMTLPLLFFTPLSFAICYVGAFVFFNTLFSIALNGTDLKVLSTVPTETEGKFDDEFWIYMNGVSVGRSWLQSNVNRLSLTFGRPVIGVHNPTSGIIFDLFQCLLQRNFSYATQDVREAYACIKEALLDPSIRKIVFILHSQGGIEGGLILDWLFAEVSRDALARMEVYTFGCAANHFNNPDLWDPSTTYGRSRLAEAKESVSSSSSSPHSAAATNGNASYPYQNTDNAKAHRTKVLGHIEHYANAGDFVSQFGVLNYTRIQNRYMGRLFLAPASGHLLNQHYLYTMFALNEERTKCADTNEFMEMEVRFNKHDVEEDEEANEVVAEAGVGPAGVGRRRESVADSLVDNTVNNNDNQGGTTTAGGDAEAAKKKKKKTVAFVGDVNAPVAPTTHAAHALAFRTAQSVGEVGEVRKLRVKDFSRLWLYRNGGEPEDD